MKTRSIKNIIFAVSILFIYIFIGCGGGGSSSPVTAAAPEFSLEGGTYLGARSVSITCSTADALIYYTTDNGDPASSGTLYTGTVKIKSTETLKAAATVNGKDFSDVTEAEFIINYTDGSMFTTTESGGALTITGYDKSAAEVAIPPVIDGKPVTAIGSNAFFDISISVSVVTSIIVPDSVSTIEDRAFNQSMKLRHVELPDSITSMGVEVFAYCEALENITFPASLDSIPDSTFNSCKSLSSFTIPGTVNSIGSNVFAGCSALESITIPGSVTAISSGAFSNSGLKSINIPDSITVIESDTFGFCTSLTGLTLPDSVTGIGFSAFEGCSLLEEITIPASVTSIANNAFIDCSSLKTVILNPETPPSLGDSVFSNNHTDRKFYVPAGRADTYKTADKWSVFSAVIF